ncbi:MAG: OsmC family protein [Rikenellaceae bacterium]|nr:OsmC family protein [Rikenellaceae bacterium]
MEKITVKMTKEMGFVPVGTKCSELNPKALMLLATADCAGRTAVGVFKKMKLTPESFEITVAGTISTDTMVAETVFTAFDITYNVECATLTEQERFSHAINLTHDKYCGMLAMMRRIAPVTHNILIHSNQPQKA